MQEKVDAELNRVINEHRKKIEGPNVVPMSVDALKISDNDQNSLYSLVCLRDQAADYIKVLKNNGFPAQQFDCDPQGYL